jgi:uncharacterized protein YigE (DUF2233 family)
MSRSRVVPSLALAGALAASALAAGSGAREETLAVREGSRWTIWWRRNSAPARWDGASLAGRVVWRAGRPGIEWGEVQLRGASEAWRTRVIVVRLDPRRVRLSLVPAFTGTGTWSLSDVDSSAALALDAGQFRRSLPWGWVVTRGRELLPPEFAPLAGAVAVDSSGRVRVVAPESVAAARRDGSPVEAFQSFPMLLHAGVVPLALHEPGLGVDTRHRDARLALGTLPDGRVIIALTRFDGLGSKLGRIPFGLTQAEMAAVMGALGCRDALALDGGISGQLLVRDASGGSRSWPGIRSVPLGLVGRANP